MSLNINQNFESEPGTTSPENDSLSLAAPRGSPENLEEGELTVEINPDDAAEQQALHKARLTMGGFSPPLSRSDSQGRKRSLKAATSYPGLIGFSARAF